MKKALVLTLAFALGLGIAAFAGPLSGSWSTDITLTIDPQSGSVTVSDFASELIVDYTVGGWVFESDSTFTLAGWDSQVFTADGVLGAFTIGSTLEFDPAGASFTSWDTTGNVSIAGVAFDGRFVVLGDWGSGWIFGASGGAGDLSVDAKVYFNAWPIVTDDTDDALGIFPGYCFCWKYVDFDISFPFACIELVDVDFGFSILGFNGVTFTVEGIAVPAVSWVTFDAELSFNEGIGVGKELTLTPSFDLGDFTCITLYYEFYGEDGDSCDTYLDIQGLSIYGIGLSYTWNGVTFESLSVLDWPDHYVTSATDGDIADIDGEDFGPYWEAFAISSEADSCCGGGIDFSVVTFFACDSEMLFDWGETDIDLSMGLGSNFTVTTGLVVDTTGFTELSFGFEVTW